MADDGKSLSALLNGLTRRIYYGEEELTDEFLKNEIYPNLTEEEFEHLVNRTIHLMKNMVSADMDMTQLEMFLTAQMKKREGAMTEQQANIYRKFWKTHKTKIHDKIVAQTMWGNTLQKVSWRIDLKSQARRSEDINTSSAIMELQIGEHQNKDKLTEVVRFEMDEDKLKDVLKSMQEIEEQIDQYCKK
ncbi:COMM domain-containing protein 1 [Patella vulgata]|uniref:COMM domain-containing protein 1 n=1 Tax=Patella vulgata TaxID=6465 RepID=UPI00217F42D3|nr:COMM domain-containing protein 1 [Patella vulgata]